MNKKIVKQGFYKVNRKKGVAKLFLEISEKIASKINFTNRYNTNIDEENDCIELIHTNEGTNKITHREAKNLFVVDKDSSDIREVLDKYEKIKITYYVDEEGVGRILIEGHVLTASKINSPEETKRPIKSISFCAGAGISSYAEKEAGFEKVAMCEYYPKKDDKDDYFANILEKNFPESILFNVPMEQLKASDIPYSDFWSCTLDCTDYSKLASSKKKKSTEDREKSPYCTMHLFMHMMRLFWEKPVTERPKAILIENVEGFEAIAGNSIRLCLEEQGYEVVMKKINSLDYMSRTKRERFFLFASCYEGFSFPEAIGRLDTPIIDDGVMTIENIDWVTPEESGTLRYHLGRQDGKKMTHNHKITSFDITKDSYIGTIPKSHYKCIPENLLKHPFKENTYAYIKNEKHLRYIHGIPEDIYLGSSNSAIIKSIGQGVCYNTFKAIAKQIYNFLYSKMFVDNANRNNQEFTINCKNRKTNHEEYEMDISSAVQLSFI